MPNVSCLRDWTGPNLRGYTELKEERAQDESSSETKQASHDPSQYSTEAIEEELMYFPTHV